MDVLKVDLKSPEAEEQFALSLKETGFAVVTNHSIDYQLVEDVLEEWKQFFASDEKFNYRFKEDYDRVQDGYFPMDVAETAKGFDVKDIKEFYGVYACKPLPKGIGPKTLEMRQQLMDLASILLGWVEEHTPDNIRKQLSMPLPDMVDEEYNTMLRILHYPPLPDDVEPGAERAAPHEDINLITLLVSATAPGLQVLDAQDKWQDVPCDKNAIVVNTGDMLQEATNFYYKATKHRVVNPIGEAAKESRFSFPLFLHPRDEVRLSDRYTRLEYLNERLAEIGVLGQKAAAKPDK